MELPALIGVWLASIAAAVVLAVLLYNVACFLVPGPRHQPNLKLQGKTVLITGGSSGLGKAMAFEFCSKGARVIIASRNAHQLQQVCSELEACNSEFRWKNPHKPTFIQLDLDSLKDESILQQKVAEILAVASNGNGKSRGIDVLVNNAALMNRSPCISTSMDVYRQLMETNYFGVITLTQALFKHIPEGGAIATIGSIAGRIGVPYLSAYCATKHAIQAWMDALRCEDRPHLQVLTVTAGYINSGMGTRALTAEGRQAGDEDPYQLRGYTVEYAARRIVNALVHRETELLLAPFLPCLTLSLRLFTPNLLWYILHRRAEGKKTRKV